MSDGRARSRCAIRWFTDERRRHRRRSPWCRRVVGFVWLPLGAGDAQFAGRLGRDLQRGRRAARWRRGRRRWCRRRTDDAASWSRRRCCATRAPNSIGRGATLALRCTMCHGARGMSEANSPNLAGPVSPPSIYKQLQDFKSGARDQRDHGAAGRRACPTRTCATSPPTTPTCRGRRAYTPRATAARRAIVASGAPMRNIAPCGACHGGIDNKAGSPWLDGLPAAYLQAQLAGLRVRRAPQRYQRADAQRRAPDDAGGDRRGRALLLPASRRSRFSAWPPLTLPDTRASYRRQHYPGPSGRTPSFWPTLRCRIAARMAVIGRRAPPPPVFGLHCAARRGTTMELRE